MSNDPRDVDLRHQNYPIQNDRRVLETEAQDIPVVVTSTAQTGVSTLSRFAHRLGPKIENTQQIDHRETITKTVRNVIEPTTSSNAGYPADYFDDDEDSNYNLMWESFTEDELSDHDYSQPLRLKKRAKTAQPDRGSAPFVVRDRRAEALCLLKVQTNFLQAYHDTWKEQQGDQSFRMPTLTLAQSEEMTKSSSILACPEFDPEIIRVFRRYRHRIPTVFPTKTGRAKFFQRHDYLCDFFFDDSFFDDMTGL